MDGRLRAPPRRGCRGSTPYYAQLRAGVSPPRHPAGRARSPADGTPLKLSHLTGVDYGDGEVQSYTFDPMGNRLTRIVNGIAEGYTYDNANRLLTRGNATYTNDPSAASGQALTATR